MKVKSEDTVVVITGKDKGKKSSVARVISKHNKIIVDGVNLVTKHIKKTATSPGQKIKLERGIDVSNVKVFCSSCKKAIRVAYGFTEEGKKFRKCKKCGESLDVKKVAKKIKA